MALPDSGHRPGGLNLLLGERAKVGADISAESQNAAITILAREGPMKLVIEARLIDDLSESPAVHLATIDRELTTDTL